MKIDLRYTVAFLGISAVVSAGGAYITGLNGLVLFGITSAALLVVGLVATFGPDDPEE